MQAEMAMEMTKSVLCSDAEFSVYQAFKELDVNKNGHVSPDEIRWVMAQYGLSYQK